MSVSAMTDSTLKEIVRAKSDFQEIVRMLVEFDEKSGRFGKGNFPDGHYLRKAAGIADLDDVRFFARDLGGYVFYVVVELKTHSSFCVTSWIHEDGIRVEREEYANDKAHPVHGIVCLSDIFEKNAKEKISEEEKLVFNPATLDLLYFDRLYETRNVPEL